ncbi:MAG: enoyl-CoA hydratase/isomerase family protein [Acidobacteriia bacterium]|nr:enoyl-CoA hydratase/isomerase family protein [Terriglobia bacterium]
MRTSREGRLLKITLDRPEKRNALTTAMCQELVDQLEGADADRTLGAMLLDADGPAFCAGMDLDESLLPDAAARTAIHEKLFTLGTRLTKPLVAAVQGPALAGGMGLAANAHIVIASEEATFGLTEIRIGMWPFIVYRAVKLAVGERRALDLSLTGRTFGADEAEEWGLAQYVVPRDQLAAKAAHIAGTLAQASPEAIRRGLTLVNQSRDLGAGETARLALTLRERLFRSEDYQEGVRAFREKRAPRWPSLESGKS